MQLAFFAFLLFLFQACLQHMITQTVQFSLGGLVCQFRKCINRDLFSCIQSIIILKQLDTYFYPLSAGFGDRPQRAHPITTPFQQEQVELSVHSLILVFLMHSILTNTYWWILFLQNRSGASKVSTPWCPSSNQTRTAVRPDISPPFSY